MEYFKGKKVLVTGDTGFMGAWLCEILLLYGAKVVGFASKPSTNPSLFEVLKLQQRMTHYDGDIRDYGQLEKVFCKEEPEIVIHMAAQTLVGEAYKEPKITYDINVGGTTNVLECVRKSNTVKMVLNVTTDKVYKNKEWAWGYREDDELDGYDPYSNSKSCTELLAHSYYLSFFKEAGISIASVRSGNVIGGGDFAFERIVPSCVKAVMDKKEIVIRNPTAVRPYQHVLEQVFAYLLVAKNSCERKGSMSIYNIGPDERDCVTTGKIATLFHDKSKAHPKWIFEQQEGPHEANFLRLDSAKMKAELQWDTTWNIEKAIEKTCEWTEAYLDVEDMIAVTDKQILEFDQEKNWNM